MFVSEAKRKTDHVTSAYVTQQEKKKKGNKGNIEKQD